MKTPFVFSKQSTGLTVKPRRQAQTVHVIALRMPSGLSGDMLISGLSRLAGVENGELGRIVESIGLQALSGSLEVLPHSVNQISGWQAKVMLPYEHAHRRCADILAIIDASALSVGAKKIASSTFCVLAEAEARVHSIDVADVTFHEVGALDSILDICVAAVLFDRIAPAALHCGPLPICDGTIHCEHGVIASPAPAVQEMLAGVEVVGIGSEGETVTPTALAFLLGAGARFGPWPRMTVERVARAYGGRVLPRVPNGAIFALGNRRQ